MIMKFKGTKGSWGDIGGGNSSIDIVLEDNSTISISRYDRYGSGLVGSREEMEANARLISKAPEMLEILEKCLKHMNVHSEESCKLHNEAKKLIKEATEL